MTVPKKPDNRSYPDEFLIAHILDKYLAIRPQKPDCKRVVILTESWSGNGGMRNGSKNTPAINDQILEAIKQSEEKHKYSERKEENTLILVPFLYGYHHPGIAIDIRNKVAIYLDPKGWQPEKYKETEALKEQLKKIGFNFIAINIPQQSSVDGTSCGPILTASMMKFLEEFFQFGKITPAGFKPNKRNLATDRMIQMYINNIIESKGRNPELQEIMLADGSLWEEFFVEQGIDKRLANLTIGAIGSHKSYIEEPIGLIDPKRVQLISDFQFRIIERVLLGQRKLKNLSLLLG